MTINSKISLLDFWTKISYSLKLADDIDTIKKYVREFRHSKNHQKIFVFDWSKLQGYKNHWLFVKLKNQVN